MTSISLGAETTGEEGHAVPALAELIAGGALVALGIGAGTDTDWLACAGGIVGGLGLIVAGVLSHRFIDYPVFHRLDDLEKRP